MGIFTRAVAGAVAGGLMTGDWGGMAGGATMGSIGWSSMKKLGSNSNIGSRAMRGAQTGLGMGLGGLKTGSRFLRQHADGGALGTAAGYGMRGLGMAGRGVSAARGFLGANAMNANKYAGYGMAAMGTAAGAYIGSTALRSNRGY